MTSVRHRATASATGYQAKFLSYTTDGVIFISPDSIFQRFDALVLLNSILIPLSSNVVELLLVEMLQAHHILLMKRIFFLEEISLSLDQNNAHHLCTLEVIKPAGELNLSARLTPVQIIFSRFLLGHSIFDIKEKSFLLGKLLSKSGTQRRAVKIAGRILASYTVSKENSFYLKKARKGVKNKLFLRLFFPMWPFSKKVCLPLMT